MQLVLDTLGNTPAEKPYKELQEKLPQSHTQSFERFATIPSLNGQSPRTLLMAMLVDCPMGEEKSKFFPCLLLHWLPRELRNSTHA